MSVLTYTCAWCGDTNADPLKIINGDNTCELCEDLANE